MKSDPCRETAAALSGIMDGELPPRETETAQEHLAGCVGCRAELEMLAGLQADLAALESPEPRADALERLHARVSAEPRRSRLVPVVAGLAVVAVVVVALAATLPRPWEDGGPARPMVAATQHTLPVIAEATIPTPPEPAVMPVDDPPDAQTVAAPVDVQPKPRRVRNGPRRHKRARPSPPAEDTGSLILVSIVDPTPPRAPEPAPGMTLTLGEVNGEDGRPGAQFAVLRTVGPARTVESIELAYYGTENDPVELGTGASTGTEENGDETRMEQPVDGETDAGDGGVGDGGDPTGAV